MIGIQSGLLAGQVGPGRRLRKYCSVNSASREPLKQVPWKRISVVRAEEKNGPLEGPIVKSESY